MKSAINENDVYLWYKANGRWEMNPNFYLKRLFWNGGKVKILTKCPILRDMDHPQWMESMNSISEIAICHACWGVPPDRPHNHTMIGLMKSAKLTRYWSTLPTNHFYVSGALSFHYEFSGDYSPIDNKPFDEVFYAKNS